MRKIGIKQLTAGYSWNLIFPFGSKSRSNEGGEHLDDEVNDFHSTEDWESWRDYDDITVDMITTCQESHSASYYRHLSLHSVLHITMDLVEGCCVEVYPN